MKLIIFSLASFRLLYLLYKERGFLRVGYLFRRYMSYMEETRLLIECPNCLSAWTSIIIYCLTLNKNNIFNIREHIYNILSIWSLTNIFIWTYQNYRNDLSSKYKEHVVYINNYSNEYIVFKTEEYNKHIIKELMSNHRYNLFGDVEYIGEMSLDKLNGCKINLYDNDVLIAYIRNPSEWSVELSTLSDDQYSQVFDYIILLSE